MFQTACGREQFGGWGLAPSEFWNMTPREWWLLWEVNGGRKHAIHRDDMERCRRLYYQARNEETP